MVELATRPELTFKVGRAEDLPFADGTFDPVGCNIGMHHFPHPEKALADASAFRILRPGGRIAFTVWASRDKAIALGVVLKAIEAYGETDFGLPEGPPFFQFSDHGECTRVLLESHWPYRRGQTTHILDAASEQCPLRNLEACPVSSDAAVGSTLCEFLSMSSCHQEKARICLSVVDQL